MRRLFALLFLIAASASAQTLHGGVCHYTEGTDKGDAVECFAVGHDGRSLEFHAYLGSHTGTLKEGETTDLSTIAWVENTPRDPNGDSNLYTLTATVSDGRKLTATFHFVPLIDRDGDMMGWKLELIGGTL